MLLTDGPPDFRNLPNFQQESQPTEQNIDNRMKLKSLSLSLSLSYNYLNNEYLDSSKELECIIHRTVDDESDHSSESLALSLEYLVLGVGGEPGVDDSLDVGRALQELSDSHRALLMLSHADMERFQTSVGQVAIERTRNTTRSYNTRREGKAYQLTVVLYYLCWLWSMQKFKIFIELCCYGICLTILKVPQFLA